MPTFLVFKGPGAAKAKYEGSGFDKIKEFAENS